MLLADNRNLLIKMLASAVMPATAQNILPSMRKSFSCCFPVSSSFEMIFFSPARITPSSQVIPTVEPVPLMASTAYST